jgi:hypothetical protein
MMADHQHLWATREANYQSEGDEDNQVRKGEQTDVQMLVKRVRGVRAGRIRRGGKDVGLAADLRAQKEDNVLVERR